jgi:hypothetical protein
MRCKPGQDFLPYDRPIAVSKIGSTSVNVREQFTQERLAELGAEFNLADSDWGQLYCVIRCLKE